MPLKHAIAQVINGRDLSFDEAAAAINRAARPNDNRKVRMRGTPLEM